MKLAAESPKGRELDPYIDPPLQLVDADSQFKTVKLNSYVILCGDLLLFVESIRLTATMTYGPRKAVLIQVGPSNKISPSHY